MRRIATFLLLAILYTAAVMGVLELLDVEPNAGSLFMAFVTGAWFWSAWWL